MLQAGDHDPSSFYPSFQLDCLRQPYGAPSSPPTSGGAAAGAGAGASPTSTAMDDDEEEEKEEGGVRRNHDPPLRSIWGPDVDDDDNDDAHAPSPCPARLRMDDGDGGGRRRGSGGGGFAAALEEARGCDGGAAGVPETPLRRPGSGARSRVLERGGGDGSCSLVGGYAGLDRWERFGGVGGGLGCSFVFVVGCDRRRFYDVRI